MFATPLSSRLSEESSSAVLDPLPLISCKITSPILIERAHQIASLWARVAQEKKELLEREPVAYQIMVARLDDLRSISVSIARRIGDAFPGRSMTLYAAVDTTKKVQGLALALFRKDDKSKISLLAAHPDNVPLPGGAPFQVRGAGTALVRHIAHDLLHSQLPEKTLSLLSTISATSFYNRLGFSAPNTYNPNMELAQAGLVSLVGTQNLSYHVMCPDDSQLVLQERELH